MFKIYAVTWWGDTEYYLHHNVALVRLEQMCSVMEPQNKALMDEGRLPIMPNIFEEQVFETKEEIPQIVLDDEKQ